MVTDNKTINLYECDGSTVSYPITIEHTEKADLKVELIEKATGNYTELTEGTDWTYNESGEAKSCVTGAAYSSDYQLMISLNMSITQETDWTQSNAFAPNVLNKNLDRLTLMVKQLWGKLKGSLYAPMEEENTDMRLPPASVRANKFMFFDENGNPSTDPNVVARPVSSYMQGVLTQETSKTARSALETDKNNVNAVDAAYTVLDDDDYEVIEATGGADGIPITLPTLADNAGRVLKILKVDADPGVITIDGEGAETINGEETQVLAAQHEAITVIAGTSEWKVLNAGKKSSLTVAAKSTDYTITDTDNIDILEVTTGATDKTVTLPTLADNQGRSITIKKADNGDGAVVIGGEGAETIQGAADFSMVSQFESITLYAGPTEWGVSSYDSKDRTSGEIGDVKWVLHDIEKNGWKNAKYQSKSQTTYAEFFGLVGHGYAKNAADAAVAQAAGEFRFPDGRYLFPRAGTLSWPLTPAAFDTAIDQITIANHGLEINGSMNGRPMKLLRVPGQNPTMPTGTGYTEYDQNYVRIIDADTIELYDTEAHAVDTSGTTGRIDWTAPGSGVFKLTTQGCYQGWAVAPVGFGSTVGTDNTFQSSVADGESVNGPDIQSAGGATTGPQVIIRDGNGSNENRPAFVSMNMQIKVIGVSVSTGEAYDLEVWSSGWIDVSSYGANASMEIKHDLNQEFDDLIIKGYGKTSTIEPSELYAIYSQSTGEYGGLCVGNGTTDSFIYSGGGVEFGRIRRSDNNGVTQPTEMLFKVYKPSLFAVTKASPLVTITESGPVAIETVEKTVAIPDTVTSSLNITLTAGAGINETNCIFIKNKSDEIQHVLYSTQTFNVAPGQKVKFCLDGTTLVWASSGHETVYKDFTNTDAAFTLPSILNDGWYRLTLRGAENRTSLLCVDSSKASNRAVWDPGYALTYNTVTGYISTTLSSWAVVQIERVHDAA